MRYCCDHYGAPSSTDTEAALRKLGVPVLEVVEHDDDDGWTTVVFEGDEQTAAVVHGLFDHSGNVYVYPEGQQENVPNKGVCVVCAPEGDDH